MYNVPVVTFLRFALYIYIFATIFKSSVPCRYSFYELIE